MRVLCSRTLAFWKTVPLARRVRVGFLCIPTRQGGLRRAVLGFRMSRISSNEGSKRPWCWPYSGPRAARISGVNAGESPGARRRTCRAR